jgi:hypothetical protein
MGIRTFMIAERARGELTAIPVGVQTMFLLDETGLIADAQLVSRKAIKKSAQNNKARILSAHEQVRGVIEGARAEGSSHDSRGRP